MALRVGNYVKQTSHPEWGIGRVVSIGESEKITAFFLRGRRRIFYSSSPDLEQVDTRHPILDRWISQLGPRRPEFVRCRTESKAFDWERRFFEANLHWIPGKPCVYVGVTGLTPEERFRAHFTCRV